MQKPLLCADLVGIENQVCTSDGIYLPTFSLQGKIITCGVILQLIGASFCSVSQMSKEILHTALQKCHPHHFSVIKGVFTQGKS